LQAVAVASLDNQLFVLKERSSQIDVYDAASFSPRGTIFIPNKWPSNLVDMAACCFYHCLYIADAGCKCIDKLEIPPKHSAWKVEGIDDSTAISVTSAHHVLVVCGADEAKKLNVFSGAGQAKKLNLFTTDGVLHKTVELPTELANVTCAVEWAPGQYVVTHGHRVCVVNSEGQILHTFGGLQGSYATLLDSPGDVAVDKDGFVYVDDERNDRLIVLSHDLGYLHCMPGVFTRSSTGIRRRMKVDKEVGCIHVVHSAPDKRLICQTYCRYNPLLPPF